MATSWTQADITALEKAIAKGVKSVTYQSGSVVYQSTEEMLRILDVMRREVDGAAVTRVVGSYNPGLFGCGQ